MTMKKYLLFYFGLFFSVSQFSLAMDYDQDENEYDDSYGNEYSAGGIQQNSYNGLMQNNNEMLMQPEFIPQNGMQNNGMAMQPRFVSQNGMQNNEMAMQPGFVPQNGMMLNNTIQGIGLNNSSMVQPRFVPQNMRQINNPMEANRNNSSNNITKQEHVQSLVNNVLKIKGNINDGSYGNTAKNNGIVINKNLKNKLLRLQKDLEEINKNLDNILKNESKQSSKKKKSKSAKSSSSKKSAKRRNLKKKASTFNKQRNFYTVKQLTPQNARKYVPNSSNYSGNGHKSDLYKYGIYKMKSWGTGTAVPSAPSYTNRSYFSNKSDCLNGCKYE